MTKKTLLMAGMLTLVQFVASLGWAEDAGLRSWLREADSSAADVTDVKSADRAYVDIQTTYLRLDSIDEAATLSERIESPQKRFRSHLTLAAAYAKSGQQDKCLVELKRAQPLVTSAASHADLVETCLDLTNSTELALSFVHEQGDQGQAIHLSRLVRVLVSHGFVDQALQLATIENDPKELTLLQLHIAHAVADAGMTEDTDRVVAMIDWNTKDGDTDYIRETVWLALATALHQAGQFDEARRVAGRITHDSLLRREKVALQRIAAGPEQKRASVPVSPAHERTQPVPSKRVVVRTEADRANEELEARIRKAIAKPINPSSGQFGPWDQASELARLRIDYADIAMMYDACGDRDLAIKKLREAEAAVHELTERNAFAAIFSSAKLLKTQVAIGDLEGIQDFVATVPPDFWRMLADGLVEKVLASGDVVGAKKMAQRAITAEQFSDGGSQDHWADQQITRFIRLGEEQIALELLSNETMTRAGDRSCRAVGKLLSESGREELLHKWLPEISPTARVHVSLGAVDAQLDATDRL